MSAEQDHNHSQIATFCDGILRKRDNMIISLLIADPSLELPKKFYELCLLNKIIIILKLLLFVMVFSENETI